MKKPLARFLATLLVTTAMTLAVFFPVYDLNAAEPRFVLVPNDGIVLFTVDEVSPYRMGEPRPLLTLPRTYYVELVSTGDPIFYIVRYMGLRSATSHGNLFILRGAIDISNPINVTAPFPNVTVRNSEANTVLLDFPETDSPIAVTIAQANSSLRFFGELRQSNIDWVFVEYGGTTGYIRVSDLVAPPIIPLHPNSRPPNGDRPNIGQDSPPILTIILAIGIIVPAIAIFALMFKPKVKKQEYAHSDNKNDIKKPRRLDKRNAAQQEAPRYATTHNYEPTHHQHHSLGYDNHERARGYAKVRSDYDYERYIDPFDEYPDGQNPNFRNMPYDKY